MASNPAFNRMEKDAQSGYAQFRTGGSNPVRAAGAAGAAHGATDQMTAQQMQDMYNAPSALRPGSDQVVTMDDVVMKTLGLFAVVLVMAAVGWGLVATLPGLGLIVVFGGMIATLVLGLVIAFKKTLSVPLIIGYAVVEGLFVGGVSYLFQNMFDPPGTPFMQTIVAQAIIATLATFAGMFVAYKTGLIKVTAKFRRIMSMALIGYAIFAVVNVIYAFATNTQFGIGGSGLLGIGISVFAVGLASLTLALDFDSIDRAIATGAPQKYSWLLAHGLIVTLVWLYIEFLRLLARLRSN